MRLGVVDIGTNSCRMLVAESSPGGFEEIKRGLTTTRLGAGVDRTGRLNREAIERTLEAIRGFFQEMDNLAVKEITLAGTSALRDVNNSQKLISMVEEKTGHTIRILSGPEEAGLVYKGAQPSLSGEFMLIDIGGGSTEFIWPVEDEILYHSLNLGAVRMSERYLADPGARISRDKLLDMQKRIRQILKTEFSGEEQLLSKNNLQASGAGGTITTLAAIYQGMAVYKREQIENYYLSQEMVTELLNCLSNLTLEERKELAGLQPERADIIVAGTVILLSILEFFNFGGITVTERGILEGLLQEMLADLIDKE